MIVCSERDMKAFGATIIRCSSAPGVITLRGNLGAGKTTIVRGALEACGVTSGVRSPTYTLVEFYEFKDFNIAHFDLYRLGDPEELEFLGYRDYLNADTWCFIEWPERAAGYLGNSGLELCIDYENSCRKLSAKAKKPWGQQLKAALKLM